MNRKHLRLLFIVSFVLSLVFPAAAQTPGGATGTITGNVFNPVTKEYVRNAEVRVDGTDIVTTTESGGAYRLGRVPAGAATVTVVYTGYTTVTARVVVAGGETAIQNFEISGATAADSGGADYVTMGAFVVASEREGNAKALQLQKKSMTMSRSVSSDAFGDVTEGNVGEFLKYLPGVELEYVEADTRGPRLGGLGSEYTSVTMDGMGVASADAFTQYVAFENSAAGSSNRSFGFEQVSINSIESIQINRVTAASMDASSPAGNIDLKTKRAFDLKGRRVTLNASTVFNTEEFTLKKTSGPDDGMGRKFRPNYSIDYSDVFMNGRLGILFGVSESNLYNEQYRVDHTYNRTPTATDTRPQVLTQILLKDGPKWTQRFTSTLTADFKATNHLTLSLSVGYNGYDARFYNRQVTMQAGGNNTGATTGRQNVTGDGVLSFGTTTVNTAANRQVVMGGGNGVKLSHTTTISPRFEYRRNELVVDGAFSYSHATNNYDNIVRGTVANTSVNNLQNVSFTATRSGGGEVDWQFTQTGGADWASLANYTNPRISDDNRQDDNELIQGQANARYILPTRLPVFIQIGGKVTENHRITSNSNTYDVWRYAGPGGGATGTFANFPSPFQLYGPGNQTGAHFSSLSGGGAPAFPNREALGTLFRSNPEYFVRGESTGIITVAQYEQGVYTNNPTFDIVETIPAAYVMGNTRISNVQLQGGIRFEETELESKELNPRTRNEIVAAGFPVDASGNPTTWAGMDYKYTGRGRVQREGKYHNYFPSLTAKYTILPDLLADLGWGKTIKRPNLNQIAGTRQINDGAEQVTTPNPNLLPEHSEKIVGSLSYFFGRNSSNNLQVVAGYNKLTNQQIGSTISSDEYGNTDPALEGYDFISFKNADSPVRYKTLEVSYVQNLTFLPNPFKGTSTNLSYTRTQTDRRVYGAVPHSVKGGISYRYGRFYISLNGVWRDDSPWFQGTNNRYLKSNVKYDLSGGVKITKNVSFYFSGRNIFEEPHRIFETSAGNPDVIFRYENYGTNWSFGVKGTF